LLLFCNLGAPSITTSIDGLLAYKILGGLLFRSDDKLVSCRLSCKAVLISFSGIERFQLDMLPEISFWSAAKASWSFSLGSFIAFTCTVFRSTCCPWVSVLAFSQIIPNTGSPFPSFKTDIAAFASSVPFEKASGCNWYTFTRSPSALVKDLGHSFWEMADPGSIIPATMKDNIV